MNRAHWPTKENKQNSSIFCIFSAHGKNASNGPKWGRELFFPTNPDLANILGRTDSDFENLYFCYFLDLKFPRFPNSWAGPQPFCCNISSAIGMSTNHESGLMRRSGTYEKSKDVLTTTTLKAYVMTN